MERLSPLSEALRQLAAEERDQQIPNRRLCDAMEDAAAKLQDLERESIDLLRQVAALTREKARLRRQVLFGAQLYRNLTAARLVTHADGGQYIHLGTAYGAGRSRGEPPSEIYRSVDDGRLWKRLPAQLEGGRN